LGKERVTDVMGQVMIYKIDDVLGWEWRHMPVIPATQEANKGKNHKTLSEKIS
jgi:hypothetical protein